jgi:hypothetical protein
MAKKRTKALLLFRSENDLSGGTQGIGYYVPRTVTKSQFRSEAKKWHQKLIRSGFPEIEQFATDYTGHFSPFFVKTPQSNSLSGSAATISRIYKPETEEYYRRLALFFYHAPMRVLFSRAKVPRELYLIYKTIVRLRMEGVTYQGIAKFLNSYKVRSRKIKQLRKRYTLFFVYYHVQVIEPIVNQWYKATPGMWP